MSDRIHQVLDGRLSAQALSAAEAASLDATEEAAHRALAATRREPAPDVTRQVLRRVAALPPHQPSLTARQTSRLRGVWKDAWRPRRVTFVLRPGWALACAGLAALLATGLLRDGLPWTAPSAASLAAGQPAPAPTMTGNTASAVLVQFRLEAPGARQVQLAADFTGWQPAYTLHPSGSGTWTITVPVSPGVHEYAFVVDGERWVADPLAPRVADGFGGSNSRLDVVATSARGL